MRRKREETSQTVIVVAGFGHVLCSSLASSPSASGFLVDDLWLVDRRSLVNGCVRLVDEVGEEEKACERKRGLG